MNKIILAGTITSAAIYHEDINGVPYYRFTLATKRKSETYDEIQCSISKEFLSEITKNKLIKISGEIRGGMCSAGYLDLYVQIKEILPYDETDENSVEIEGVICKPTTLRETLNGRRISDVFIACGEKSGRTDYIPCVFWGYKATKICLLEMGDRILFTGRLQSRIYPKLLEDGSSISRQTYEVSGNYFNVIKYNGDIDENDRKALLMARIDSGLKKQFQALCWDHKTDMTKALSNFVHYVVSNPYYWRNEDIKTIYSSEIENIIIPVLRKEEKSFAGICCDEYQLSPDTIVQNYMVWCVSHNMLADVDE